MQTRVTDFLIYRWRYILGYTLLVLTIIGVIILTNMFLPGGLREAEMTSSVQSGALSTKSISAHMLIDLPYHIVQRISFEAFGVSIASIKLPSAIFAVFTSIGLFLLLKTWFRTNVAMLATFVAVTTPQFLFMSQDGTPIIMFSFITVWLLFASTQITRQKYFTTLWKVVVTILMAMSFYTPMGIYLVLMLVVAAIAHPHTRHLIKKMNRIRASIAVLLGLAAIAPAVYAMATDMSTLKTLFGIPESVANIGDNLILVVRQLFDFTANSDSHLISPVYSLGILIIMLLGLYKLLTYKYTARSYITIAWSIVIIPLVILNPDKITYLFPFAALMIGLGLAALIADWYKLFPRNPYARVAGLIPLVILVTGIVATGTFRYSNSYLYKPEILKHYSVDLKILNSEAQRLELNQDNKAALYIPNEQKPFYDLVSSENQQFYVADVNQKSDAKIQVAASSQKDKVPSPGSLERIVTNSRKDFSDRFYIYKNAVE